MLAHYLEHTLRESYVNEKQMEKAERDAKKKDRKTMTKNGLTMNEPPEPPPNFFKHRKP